MIVLRITKEDTERLNEVYNIVYRYSLSLCRNEDTAQDITQEAFLRAMRSSDKFLGNSSESTWICSIARNIFLNICRAEGRSCPLEEDIPDGGERIEQRIADEDTAMQIHSILHDMPEPYKEVFSLRIFGELPFSKIAQIFGKTESWARVTYHRAKKKIAEKMKGE